MSGEFHGDCALVRERGIVAPAMRLLLAFVVLGLLTASCRKAAEEVPVGVS
jgi:hypothetical protein